VYALVRRESCFEDLEKKGVQLCFGDVSDPDSLKGLPDGVDHVYHLAGCLGKWGTPASVLYETNVTGTRNLLTHFLETGLDHFLHVSAAGVSGPLLLNSADETYSCQPMTLYEKTKFMGERVALAFSRDHGMPLTIMRPTFTYGPGDRQKLGLFQTIQQGRFFFFEEGDSLLHPAYIDDVIQGIDLCSRQEATGDVYIIGGERAATVREITHAIADQLHVRRPRWSLPLWLCSLAARCLETVGGAIHREPPLTASRVNFLSKNYGYDIGKARERLGYRPKVGLPAGIGETVRWYQEEGLL